MEPLGFDAEAALKLILILLRWIAYSFGAFALLALSCYLAFLSLEMFSSQRRSKRRLARAPRPVSRSPIVEENRHLISSQVPSLAEVATVTAEGVRQERAGFLLFLRQKLAEWILAQRADGDSVRKILGRTKRGYNSCHSRNQHAKLR